MNLHDNPTLFSQAISATADQLRMISVVWKIDLEN